MRRRRQRWLKLTLGLVSGALVLAGLGVGPGSPAGADPSPGIGSSYAQSLQVTPHEGSLAVGAVLGEALAGHTNKVARAQSQGEDLGAIGLSLEGYNCGTEPSEEQKALIPQALQAETGAPGSAEGQTLQPTDGLDKASPKSWPPSWGSTEHVVANDKPYGEADTYYGLIDGGPFKVAGMASKAWSGLVNGQRVAGAIADIGSIDLAGQVVLKNLHWEATFPSGGAGQPTGSFSIGQVTIGGNVIPSGDASAALGAVNTVLGNLGIEIDAPKASLVQGVEFVSPLQIQVVPNDNRDQILLAAVVPAQKAEYPIANGLENGFDPSEPKELVAALCQSDTPITVADITIASIDGGGYFSAGLGGVNATSGELPANEFNLSQFAPSSTPGSSSLVGGTDAVPGTAGTLGTSGDLATPGPATVAGATTGRSGSSGRARAAAAIGHAPKGPLLAIGLGGLLLLAALVEGDRRVMRRAHAFDASNFEE